VWPARVLMLTIFHHTETKTFGLASLLARKKDACNHSERLIFSSQESSTNKKFCLNIKKLSPSAQRQATHKQEISGAATSMEDAITFSVPANEIENLCICILRAWLMLSHEATECHQVGGESHQ
jgi:hypothetical protein